MPKWAALLVLFVGKGTHNNNKIIIIMHINTLSAHMTHINLNIFYTHVEHSPTKTIYIKYYTEKQTHTPLHSDTHIDCSRNWVLILAGMKIVSEEDGFQFGFKR